MDILSIVFIVMDILSIVFIVAGLFFLIVAAIGVIRLPDVFSRAHAVSLTDSLGAFFDVSWNRLA